MNKISEGSEPHIATMNLCYDYQLNSHSLLIKDAHGSSIELDILSGEPNSLNNQNKCTLQDISKGGNEVTVPKSGGP